MTEDTSARSRIAVLAAELAAARTVARRYFWNRTPTARQMEEDLARYDWLTRGEREVEAPTASR